MNARFLRFTMIILLSIGIMTAFAQQKRQKLFPSQLNRASWFGEDLLVRDNTLFVSDPEWKKDGTGIQCTVGYGALSIFKKSGNGDWTINQVIKHTANTAIENKFSRNFSYKNNVLVVSSERENYGSTTRAGAFYLYRRDHTGSSFTQVARVFSPQIQKDNEFSSGGVATNGQHIVVYDFRRQLLYLFEIQGNSVIYRSSISATGSWVKGITDENIVVVTQPNSSSIRLYKITGNSLQAVTVSGITAATMHGYTGHASVDGNTIALGMYGQTYGGPVTGWYNTYYIKVLKLQNSIVQSNDNIMFPHYTTVSGSFSDVYVRENNGIVVSFKRTDASPDITRALLLKYHEGTYLAADGAMLSEPADLASYGEYYGTGVAYDGTDMFVSDMRDKTNYSANGSPCTAQSASGAVYVYSVKDPLEYSVNGSQKLTSVLGQSSSQAERYGYSNAINGNWAFSSSFYDSDANIGAGAVSVLKKTGGQWKFIRKLYHDISDTYAQYGRATDADDAILAVGVPNMTTGGYTSRGEVVLYTISTLESKSPHKTTISCPAAIGYQQFGASVAIDGDYLAVGATGDASQGTGTGAVYIFRKSLSNNTWAFVQKITASNASSFSNFGTSVDLSNGWLMVGAPYTNNARGISAGTVYFYQLSGSSFVERAQFIPPVTRDYQYFGNSISLHNGNAVAGLRSYNSYSGAAYTYTVNGTSWTPTTALYGDGATGAHFGMDVAISGDKLIISASNHKKIFKYQKQGANWVSLGALQINASSSPGADIDLSGDDAIIGAPYSNNDRGEAYLINFWNISGARLAADEHMTDFYSADESGISLFPNPAPGNRISISAPEAILQVRAYNLMGTDTGTLPVSNGQVDISSLSEGFYTIQIETTEKIYTKRLIVKQAK